MDGSVRSVQSFSISFGDKSGGMTRRKFLWSAAAAPFVLHETQAALNNAQPGIDPGRIERERIDRPIIEQPNRQAHVNNWGEGIRALCAVGQTWSARYCDRNDVEENTRPTESDRGGSCYTDNLCRVMRSWAKNPRAGLQEVHRHLEHTGYMALDRHSYPTSTPGRLLDAWQKDQNNHEIRFAILLGQRLPHDRRDNFLVRYSKNSFNRAVLVDLNRMETLLTNELNVKPTPGFPKRILRFEAATPEDIKRGCDWLSRWAKAAIKNHPDKKVALTVYYSGHGLPRSSVRVHEGLAEGVMCGPEMRKKDFREIIQNTISPARLVSSEQLEKCRHDRQNPNLKPQDIVNTVLVFDMCHAGTMAN